MKNIQDGFVKRAMEVGYTEGQAIDMFNKIATETGTAPAVEPKKVDGTPEALKSESVKVEEPKHEAQKNIHAEKMALYVEGAKERAREYGLDNVTTGILLKRAIDLSEAVMQGGPQTPPQGAAPAPAPNPAEALAQDGQGVDPKQLQVLEQLIAQNPQILQALLAQAESQGTAQAPGSESMFKQTGAPQPK